MNISTLEAILIKREFVADQTIAVRFDVGKQLVFEAGQYVTLTLPQLDKLDPRERFRDFSITSAPHELPIITITYRAGQSVYKKTLSEMPIGTKVIIDGPKGLFTLPQDQNIPVVLVGSGVGITPFISMIRSRIKKDLSRQITLFYFNRGKESAAYLDELSSYGSAFNFLPIFGPLTPETFDIENLKQPEETVWYAAGPSGLVKTALDLIRSHNIKETNIKTEEFSGYE